MPPPVREGGGVAPVSEAFRPPPFKARLEGADLTQGPLPHELLERQEIGVPPAVLEYRQLHTGVGRPGDELFTVGRRRDERLVHHHVEAMGDGGCGEVEVGRAGGCRGRRGQGPRPGRTVPPASGRSGPAGSAWPPRRPVPDPPSRSRPASSRDPPRSAAHGRPCRRSRIRRRRCGWVPLRSPAPITAPPKGSAGGVRCGGCRRVRPACRPPPLRPRP